MPRIKNIPGPYHVYFVSFDCAEPAHVHVTREDCEAKFWMKPVKVAHNFGFRRAELNKIERLLIAYQIVILEAWHGHCGSNEP